MAAGWPCLRMRRAKPLHVPSPAGIYNSPPLSSSLSPSPSPSPPSRRAPLLHTRRPGASLTEGSSPYASLRASSVDLAAIRRTALFLSGGGVVAMMGQEKMKPWCGCAVVELKPASVRRLAPSTCRGRAVQGGAGRVRWGARMEREWECSTRGVGSSKVGA